MPSCPLIDAFVVVVAPSIFACLEAEALAVGGRRTHLKLVANGLVNSCGICALEDLKLEVGFSIVCNQQDLLDFIRCCERSEELSVSQVVGLHCVGSGSVIEKHAVTATLLFGVVADAASRPEFLHCSTEVAVDLK